jgi:hypothetical protein
MKTAMQELMDKVQSINERYELKDDANWLMNEVIDLIENSFEKEKEDIMMAFNDGKVNAVLNKINSTEYYNKNYNL